jgi:hypothetical protein
MRPMAEECGAARGAGLDDGAQTYSSTWRPQQQGNRRALASVVVHPREVLGETAWWSSRC